MIVIELYTWTICPECGYSFRLKSDNLKITGRDELPPNILSLLSHPVSSEKPVPLSEVNHPQIANRKGGCKQDNLCPDLTEATKRDNESDSHILGKEQQHKDSPEDL